MRSVIFANYLARDTMRLGPTLGVENSHVRLLSRHVLNLWDCGGQDAFMTSYYTSQRRQIFSTVSVLAYIFDLEASEEHEKELEHFRSAVEALQEYSKNAKIFCLLHKVDLIPHADRAELLQARQAELEEIAKPMQVTTYATSIWDESLYRAWSDIVYSLVPNVDKVETKLASFADLIGADEVVVFEKATFLVIARATRIEHPDPHRFEKISNIVKQFKLSCGKTQAQFESMQVKNKYFTAFIDSFTPSTVIMVIMSDPDIQPAATMLNIRTAKGHFEEYLSV